MITKERNENIEDVQALIGLYYDITFGAMELGKKSWRSLLGGKPDAKAEEFIEELQTRVQTLVNTKCKFNLTLQKGIPYSMVGRAVYINKVMESLR